MAVLCDSRSFSVWCMDSVLAWRRWLKIYMRDPGENSWLIQQDSQLNSRSFAGRIDPSSRTFCSTPGDYPPFHPSIDGRSCENYANEVKYGPSTTEVENQDLEKINQTSLSLNASRTIYWGKGLMMEHFCQVTASYLDWCHHRVPVRYDFRTVVVFSYRAAE